MKTITFIKQLFFTSVIIAGMNSLSSCNSCDRKTETQEKTTVSYETTVDEDTIVNDETSSGMNEGTTSSTSINATGTSTNKTGTQKTTVNSSKTTSASTNAKEEEAKQQAITDRIENSDAGSAVDKKGNPIKSSGDAGSGSGTGTGSTGNNSRVTTREAQRN